LREVSGRAFSHADNGPNYEGVLTPEENPSRRNS
jgi:hypothetical protein